MRPRKGSRTRGPAPSGEPRAISRSNAATLRRPYRVPAAAAGSMARTCGIHPARMRRRCDAVPRVRAATRSFSRPRLDARLLQLLGKPLFLTAQQRSNLLREERYPELFDHPAKVRKLG